MLAPVLRHWKLFQIQGLSRELGMALVWISGRTSLLATLFAVYAAVALLRGP